LLTRTQKDGFGRARAIEIGDEPPLRIDGESGHPGDSRQINLRWLMGTSLAGILGAGLLGSAVVTSMDGPYRLAAPPGLLTHFQSEAGRGRSSNALRKGDLIAPSRIDETRQVLRVSTVTKVGDREMVRTRPVTRITSGLLTAGVRDVPVFNPVAMFADDAAPPAADSDTAGTDDGDVSYVVRNLAGMAIAPDQGPVIPLEQVVASVRDVGAIEAIQNSDLRSFGVDSPDGPELAALGPVAAPNITIMPKRSRSDAGGRENERVIVAKGGERLDQVLIEQGASPQDAREIAGAVGAPSGYGAVSLAAGQTVKILMASMVGRQQPVRVIVTSTAGDSIVALSDTGGYVAVADAPEIVEEAEVVEDTETAGASNVTLYQSLYATAQAKNVPEPVIKELLRVFGYDADFQRKVGKHDGFEVAFGSDEAGELDGPPEVMFASLTTGNETRRYYRFQGPDGAVDYFDETGRSARKFLMRKPVSAGVMRSGFGMRRHPILGFSKLHTGVDWAAPRGTPIYAAGNGTIDRATRHAGYGNQVRIQHANGYATAYGHMNAFARGIKEGVRVRQGQLIGYVGSTGLSTGPHLHYEVLVNGRFVNPMRIKVPRGRELDGPALAEFQRERERLDGVMGRSGTSAAQLNSVQARGG
jgi:murein DD-endopeptidase MepM/ murein hydrolase activator NlpD